MPSKAIAFESDFEIPQRGNSEFLEKCRSLHNKINSMVKKPHIFFHEAAMYVKNILIESCELQNCYEIETQTIVNEFVMAIRLQIHIIYLLSMLAYSYTGRNTSLTVIKNQIENI